MVLISGTLQVESVVIVVHNLEHGHVIGVALRYLELLLEAIVAVVGVQGEVVTRAHDHLLL